MSWKIYFHAARVTLPLAVSIGFQSRETTNTCSQSSQQSPSLLDTSIKGYIWDTCRPGWTNVGGYGLDVHSHFTLPRQQGKSASCHMKGDRSNDGGYDEKNAAKLVRSMLEQQTQRINSDQRWPTKSNLACLYFVQNACSIAFVDPTCDITTLSAARYSQLVS